MTWQPDIAARTIAALGQQVAELREEIAQRDADMRLREGWFQRQCEAFEAERLALRARVDAVEQAQSDARWDAMVRERLHDDA